MGEYLKQRLLARVTGGCSLWWWRGRAVVGGVGGGSCFLALCLRLTLSAPEIFLDWTYLSSSTRSLSGRSVDMETLISFASAQLQM